MLNKGAKGRIAEGTDSEADMHRSISGGGNDWHVTQLLYGGGPALSNPGGAKIIYERLINLASDPGVKEALGFLTTREVAHQQSVEKALHLTQPNFPPGKLPGKPEFTNVYFNMSQGETELRGPWNKEPTFDYREAQAAVDGGSGLGAVTLAGG